MATSDSVERETDLWRVLEKRLGVPVPAKVRAFLRLQGMEDLWLALDGSKRAAVQRDAEELVRNLAEAGLMPSEVRLESSEEVTKIDDDARWPLWRELMASAGIQDWRELRIRRVFQIRPDGFPRVEHRVEIDVDARLSLSALKAKLDKLWPDLREEGWVRRTRPLDARNVALARFICLESALGEKWSKRLEDWNERVRSRGDPDEWKFKSKRDLASQVLRIDRQLTDQALGLAWFYDRDARSRTFELMQPRDIQKLPSGNRLRARKLREAALEPLHSALDAKLLYAAALLRSEQIERGSGDFTFDLEQYGLEGRRLPRVDLGEWVWRTTHEQLPERGRMTD